ncbi:uncharacterized protein METZ01_LOCUS403232 [marine metagenome]|uniref:Uncharacterized protein n=1 Tax=marine metagenome TaxID=408172 RepID=A0A382VWZ4_9ZZZZ
MVDGDAVAGFEVHWNTADKRHEDSRFARDIGAQIPGVALWHKRHIGQFVALSDPGIFSVGISFDRCQGFSAHIV